MSFSTDRWPFWDYQLQTQDRLCKISKLLGESKHAKHTKIMLTLQRKMQINRMKRRCNTRCGKYRICITCWIKLMSKLTKWNVCEEQIVENKSLACEFRSCPSKSQQSTFSAQLSSSSFTSRSNVGILWPRVARSDNQAFVSSTSPNWNGRLTLKDVFVKLRWPIYHSK